MTKFQIKEKIRKHIESLKPGFRLGTILIELDDNLQVYVKVNFRFNDDYDYSGNLIVSKRQIELILSPEEYAELIELIIRDIKM